ncbi:MAG: YfiM family protein [Schleiferiaceae bacterium]|nr:YfiM family protein [Schleiferiaceae bacterium]
MKKTIGLLLLMAFSVLISASTLAGEGRHFSEYSNSDSTVATKNSATGVNPTRFALVSSTLGAFYIGGMVYLNEVWYRDKERVPLHFYNDNAGWKQMDKVAHAYVAYHQSRAGYHALRWSGVDKRKALWYGGSLGFVLQLPIEIFDGIYEGYGFSWGDVGANAAGSVLFMTQQHFFDEQPVSFKFSFYPSEYAALRPRALGQNTMEQLFMDYNAQRYWLSIGLNRLWQNERIPDWLNLAIGYSGGGMLGEFENPRFVGGRPVPPTERYRQFFIAHDIDFGRIKTNKTWLKSIYQGLNLLKFPAPAIEYNTQFGWQFHLIFF